LLLLLYIHICYTKSSITKIINIFLQLNFA